MSWKKRLLLFLVILIYPISTYATGGPDYSGLFAMIIVIMAGIISFIISLIFFYFNKNYKLSFYAIIILLLLHILITSFGIAGINFLYDYWHLEDENILSAGFILCMAFPITLFFTRNFFKSITSKATLFHFLKIILISLLVIIFLWLILNYNLL